MFGFYIDNNYKSQLLIIKFKYNNIIKKYNL